MWNKHIFRTSNAASHKTDHNFKQYFNFLYIFPEKITCTFLDVADKRLLKTQISIQIFLSKIYMDRDTNVNINAWVFVSVEACDNSGFVMLLELPQKRLLEGLQKVLIRLPVSPCSWNKVTPGMYEDLRVLEGGEKFPTHVVRDDLVLQSKYMQWRDLELSFVEL